MLAWQTCHHSWAWPSVSCCDLVLLVQTPGTQCWSERWLRLNTLKSNNLIPILTMIIAIIGATKTKMVPFSVDNQQLSVWDALSQSIQKIQWNIWLQLNKHKLTKKALHYHHVLHSSRNVLLIPQPQITEEYLCKVESDNASYIYTCNT